MTRVRLVDKTTKINVIGVTVGDRVMAKVDDRNHGEFILRMCSVNMSNQRMRLQI